MKRAAAALAFLLVPATAHAAPVTACSHAVVFVVDRSGSMSGAPMEMAKLAARTVVTALPASDCFGMITFDSVAMDVVPVGPVRDRRAVEARIAGVSAGGGTNLFAGLDLGRTAAASVSGAKRRTVVLLTDGQSSLHGLRDLAQAMATDGIEVSTIGLGTGVDEALLRMLATEGGGRSYFVREPAKLPGVLVKEVATVIRDKR